MKKLFQVGDKVTYETHEGVVTHYWEKSKQFQAHFKLGDQQFIVLFDHEGHTGISRYNADWPMIQKI